MIFYDLRGERERLSWTSAFVAETFPHFGRQEMKVHFVTMTEADRRDSAHAK